MSDPNDITPDDLRRTRTKYERSCVERDQAWKDYCHDPCEEMYELYVNAKDEEQTLLGKLHAICADVSEAECFFLIDFRSLTPAEIKAGQELEELAQEVIRKEQLRIEKIVKDYIRLVYPWAVTARINQGVFYIYSGEPSYHYTWSRLGHQSEYLYGVSTTLGLNNLTEEEERNWKMDL